MGIHSPQALINTLWFNNCLHSGIRGGKEQSDLSWGDVVLKTDCHGKEYLEYSTERQTKTRPGDNPLNRRQIKPRMYENLSVPDERNPISAFKLYMTKRPKKTLVDGSPFYLTIKNLGREKLALSSAKWFKCQPMGVSKLNTLIRDCSKAAGLATDKRITNYSARKTLVQKLRDSDVPPTEIVQITGHKNLQSINNYSSSGEKQQMAISTLLSTACSSTSVSQQLQSQTVPEPVTQQEFSSTFVSSKS